SPRPRSGCARSCSIPTTAGRTSGARRRSGCDAPSDPLGMTGRPSKPRFQPCRTPAKRISPALRVAAATFLRPRTYLDFSRRCERCAASRCGKSTSIADVVNAALNIALEARLSACFYHVMSTTLIEVRRAKPPDAPAIAATHDEAWRGAYQGIIPGPELDKLINRRGPLWWDCAVRKGSRIMVLAFGECVAGYANYGRNRARSLYYDGEIYELYLRPEFQGLGFGRKLFSAARRDLVQSGLQSLVIWALSDNEPAVGFYRAL